MKKLLLCLIPVIILMFGCTGSAKPAENVMVNSTLLTLDQAIAEAAIRIDERIPAGSKIAPLNFNSPHDRFSDYVLEELTANLVESRKLTVVDRREIDLIRNEVDFQFSGEVRDDSMQEIGRMLGAQSIISGNFTDMGGFIRIMIRVLNVQNASVEVQYRANVVSDMITTALLTGGRTNTAVVTPIQVTQSGSSSAVQASSIPDTSSQQQTAPQTSSAPVTTSPQQTTPQTTQAPITSTPQQTQQSSPVTAPVITPPSAVPAVIQPTAPPVQFLEATPSYDRSGATVGNATLAGVQYRNAFVLSTRWGGYSLHNLNRRYARFTGEIGRVDGTPSNNATVSFYGDGMLLRTFNLMGNDLPVDFDLQVEGIRQLTIEFGGSSNSDTRYALVDAFLIPSATPTPVTFIPPASSVSFLEETPSYDRSGATVGNATLASNQYQNVLILSTRWGGYSLHNLNRRFTRVTGSIGRVDGTPSNDATVSFYGDGALLRTFNLKANDLPVDFDLQVEGIRQLRIEFGGSSNSDTRYALINTVLIP